MALGLYGTTNFTVEEWDAVSTGGYTPAVYRSNAQATLEVLQTYRDALGVPIILTDGWRSPEENSHTAGSAPNSQHLEAKGVDFVVPSLSKREVARRLDAAEDAGQLADYRQFIYYLPDQHYHLGTGAGNQKLVKLDSSTYGPYLGPEMLPDTALTGVADGAPWALLVIVAALIALALILRESP